MTIAVTTPTGNVGRHVVGSLLRAGVRPRLLLRDPAKLPPEVAAEVDAVAVDQGDEDAVLAATAGVDALFWVDPPTEASDPVAEYRRVGAIAARAVVENGIGHVVFQSSVGAEKRSGAGEIDGLASTEEALDGTGAAVVHLRCGFFFTNLLLQLDAVKAGTVPVVLPVDAPMAWVAPRDIAEVAAGWLLSREWTGRNVQAVHGPVDLSWAEAARIVSEGLGRTVTVERVPDDDMRSLLSSSGMGDGLVEAVMGMSTGLRENFVPEQPRTVRTTTPTTLAEWVRAELVGQV
jgi:uncharacterized protein YbjT (DUF2867 family)